MTSLSKERPFAAFRALSDLKYELLENGLALDGFHATEDRQAIRNRVFQIIREHSAGVVVDSVIVDKRNCPQALSDERVFYPSVLGQLLVNVLHHTDLSQFSQVIVITDRIPIQKKRNAVEAAVKETLARRLPRGIKYQLIHHESKTNFDLQIVDYLNWAIYRKWESGDARSFDQISHLVRSEADAIAPLIRYLMLSGKQTP